MPKTTNEKYLTEKKFKEGLMDLTDAILSGVDRLVTKTVQELRKEMNGRFDVLEAGQKDLQRQIDDIKADVPTQEEVDTLKRRLDTHLLHHS